MRGSRFTFIMTLFSALGGGWGLFSCSTKQPTTSESEFHIQIEAKEAISTASVRGLFLVNDQVGWASGTGGTFLRMIDGENWTADTIAGYTHLDFRDVHAFDANTALLMAAGEEGRILRTEDGGISWTEVYTRLDSGIFLDGMDFHGNVGYCYGDPIDGKFVVIRSDDFGKTWEEVSKELLPNSLPHEAGFAASGTGLLSLEKMIYVATGGDSLARIMRIAQGQEQWDFFNTPLRSETGCGIFSITAAKQNLIAVGGCYLDSANATGNCAVSADWGETWSLIAENQPRGYRSCVAYAEKSDFLLTTGRTGMDYSLDQGYNWTALTDEGFNTCALADSTGWAMGKSGKIAKLSWSLSK